MAKKQTKASYQGDPGDEHIEKVAPVVETPKPKVKVEPKKPTWEIKDRVYVLKDGKTPLSKSIRSANVFWFDEEKGYEREIKYCENQRSCFVDEMQGEQRLSHIIFRNGVLAVPKNKSVLQKFLSTYHPHVNIMFEEVKPEEDALEEIDYLEMEISALNEAMNMDVDMAEAIMRVEIGSKVSEMSSKELKRDLILYARRNPELFLELVEDDNVVLRNFGIKATEIGLLKLSSDQRSFTWGSNGRKLMNVPFDEHPYSALAAWFKTDEGMEIYTNIEKQLK
jgi:hypothetical protein